MLRKRLPPIVRRHWDDDNRWDDYCRHYSESTFPTMMMIMTLVVDAVVSDRCSLAVMVVVVVVVVPNWPYQSIARTIVVWRPVVVMGIARRRCGGGWKEDDATLAAHARDHRLRCGSLWSGGVPW